MEQLALLNNKQKEAVTCVEQHVRIIAGAGSGKTRVVTTRIAYLIKELGVLPYRILAITFTNKAAKEMKERVTSILGSEDSGVKVSTIHSLCVRILREDIRHLNYPQAFTILDSDDQKTILKNIYKQLDVSVKDISYGQILGYISNFKCELMDAMQAASMANEFTSDKIKAEIYMHYEAKLKEMHALDFDDLIIFVYQLFAKFPEVRMKWQSRFDYIHVDEFQDVDNLQYAIVKALVKEDSKLCVVGDPDQTIYTWRGAQVDIIMNFDKDFKDARSIVLNENYRSTPDILQAANSLIKNNTYRIDKELFTQNKNEQKVQHREEKDENEEAVWIAKRIRDLLKKGESHREIAILYRSNYLSRALEKAMLEYQIPYRIYGGIKFFERAEIKDAISYLRLLLVQNDAVELAVRRVINVPKRGVGPKAILNLEMFSAQYELDFYSVLQQHSIAKGATQSKVDQFVQLIETYRAKAKEVSISLVLKGILEDSGYYKMLEDNQESERLENLQELIGDIQRYEQDEDITLEEYLQMISLYTDTEDNNQQAKCIQMMSIHAAKGLEFDNVFVYQMCEGVFPSEKSVQEGGNHALEEERRLAYVAYTRARKRLYITSSCGFSYVLQKMKTSSRFVNEIDDEVLDKIVDKPSFQSQEYKYNSGAIMSNARNSASKNTRKARYKPGDIVIHSVFQEGVVLKVREDVLEIAFSAKYGIRRIAATHPSITKK